MATTKKKTYVEPAGYFNSAMKKAEKEYDKMQKAKQPAKPSGGKKTNGK